MQDQDLQALPGKSAPLVAFSLSSLEHECTKGRKEVGPDTAFQLSRLGVKVGPRILSPYSKPKQSRKIVFARYAHQRQGGSILHPSLTMKGFEILGT